MLYTLFDMVTAYIMTTPRTSLALCKTLTFHAHFPRSSFRTNVSHEVAASTLPPNYSKIGVGILDALADKIESNE